MQTSSSRRATLRDVAAAAGVSFKTVSRVVNGETGVSAALTQRVQEAVIALNYRHNGAARSLRTGSRSRTIGVLVQDISNDFSSSVLRSLDDCAREQELIVVTASLDEEIERERTVVKSLIARRVDGLVLMAADRDHSYLTREIASGLAVVAVDRPLSGIDVDAVVVDNRRGTKRAVSGLIGLGHHRIGYIGDNTGIYTADERLAGYREAMVAAGLPIDDRLVVTSARSEHEGRRAAERLLDLHDPPSALFCARNVLTAGVFRTLTHRDLQWKVALIGFDDFPLADVLAPAVTVVRQNPILIGETAAQLLVARLDQDPDHESVEPPRTVELPTMLVRRGSGEIPPLS